MQHLLHDRFQKGAEMLGHAEIESVRIGGILALARLASEHPDVFHLPVMQLFCAFVVDRTRQDAAERSESITESERSADKERSKVDTIDSGEDKNDIGRNRPRSLEFKSAEYFGPLFDADMNVGPVPELAKDVKEVMSQIVQRNQKQIELESKNKISINLADASLPGLIFHKADFSNFEFTKADLRRVRGLEACLKTAVLPGADLSAANMNGAEFRYADMRRVNLTAAQLIGADLRNANLGLVDIVGQNLWKGALFPSRLVGVQLQGADLREADLSCADIRGASLGGAKLDKVDLARANLSGADLRATSLRGSDLSRADLSNANLGGIGADLSEADLTGADLEGANLGSANLTNAKLTNAIVSNANFSHDWRKRTASPARGLTQQQLDEAIAGSSRPPILDGVLDSETNRPLIWKGD